MFLLLYLRFYLAWLLHLMFDLFLLLCSVFLFSSTIHLILYLFLLLLMFYLFLLLHLLFDLLVPLHLMFNLFLRLHPMLCLFISSFVLFISLVIGCSVSSSSSVEVSSPRNFLSELIAVKVKSSFIPSHINWCLIST